MALPNAISYALPDATLPEARVDWNLERDRAALLIHDMQRYFVRPYADDSPALVETVANQQSLIDAAHSAGVPVVYSVQPGAQSPESRGLLQDRWGPGIGSDVDDTAVIDALAPSDRDYVLTKHRYSAFIRTELESWLAEHGRDQLIITGVYGHIGITATALDAFMRDIQPFLVADGIVDFGRGDHLRTLDHVSRVCGMVIDARTTLKRLL